MYLNEPGLNKHTTMHQKSQYTCTRIFNAGMSFRLLSKQNTTTHRSYEYKAFCVDILINATLAD